MQHAHAPFPIRQHEQHVLSIVAGRIAHLFSCGLHVYMYSIEQVRRCLCVLLMSACVQATGFVNTAELEKAPVQQAPPQPLCTPMFQPLSHLAGSCVCNS